LGRIVSDSVDDRTCVELPAVAEHREPRNVLVTAVEDEVGLHRAEGKLWLHHPGPAATRVDGPAVSIRTRLLLDTCAETLGEPVVEDLAELLLDVGLLVRRRCLLLGDIPAESLAWLAFGRATEQNGL